MVEYLTVAELALYLKRSSGAIRMMVLRRLIPYRRCGGRLTFLKSEIDQWAEQCEGVKLEEAVKANTARR